MTAEILLLFSGVALMGIALAAISYTSVLEGAIPDHDLAETEAWLAATIEEEELYLTSLAYPHAKYVHLNGLSLNIEQRDPVT